MAGRSPLRRYYSPSSAIQGLGLRVITGLPFQQCASAQRSGLQSVHLRSPDGLESSKSPILHFTKSLILCLKRAVLRAKCMERHETWKKFASYMLPQFLASLVEFYQRDPENDPNNMPQKVAMFRRYWAADHHCAGITLRAQPYRGLVYESLFTKPGSGRADLRRYYSSS